ncbi:MAG: Thiol:disulfide interchange protein [Hydrocarboniphaga sp.]|uniref:DsbC family protein n=1 Tax=Hydrocarboniphaga sp. TaxID=2033016 RepID=UPI00262F704A|nr:DsbC family protein [Hydrocarboniphaga sp.]MDB5971038.1 Thiol:disulfide interchange protein [Hydrocarboniphaga sp.]
MKNLRYCLPLLLLSLAACAPPTPEAGDKAVGPKTAAVPQLPATDNPAELAAVRAAIQANMPDLAPEAVRASPMPGVYEIQIGMNFGYVTADGRYLIAGDLTDLKTRQEITEDRRREARVALIDKIDRAGFIEFAPETTPAKYTVTVFTDVDCGYCRMLHRQIKDYNALGIAVRYVFFPRTGPNTPSYYQAEEVWCSADRKAALTKAKTGVDLNSDKSCANPVMEHLQAAAQLGLRGTPSIVLPSGELVPGYRAPADLLQVLQHTAGALPPPPTG